MGFDAIAAVGEDVLASGAADAAAGAAVDAGAGAAAAGAADVGATAAAGAAGAGAADVGATALGAGAADAAAGAGAGAAGLSSADAAAIYGGAGYGAAADATALGAGATDAAALGAAGADVGGVGSSITGGAGGAFSDAGFAASDAGAATGLDSSYVGAGTADYSAGAGSGVPGFNDATGQYTDSIGSGSAQQVTPDVNSVNADNGVTPTGNSSIDNALKQLGAFGSTASKFAPVASLGMNAYAQHKTQSAADKLNGVAKPASDVSNKLLGQYQSGTLNPADAYAIAQWSQQQTASIKNYYANAGLSNSSMEAEALSKVGAQADSMRSQAVQSLLSGGLQAAGLAQGPQVAAVNASVAADQQLSQASSNFMAALAKMNTQQTGTASTTTTPGG